MKLGTKKNVQKEPAFIVVWEFLVQPGKPRQFEKAYGPDGYWATLFHNGEGYIHTALIRDIGIPNRYLTLDFWISRRDYERFTKKNRAEYQAIDKECEALTRRELEIGRFARSQVRS